MKLTKTTQGTIQVNIDSGELADAIGKAVARELAPLLKQGYSLTGIVMQPGQIDRNGDLVEIDERIIDVGVSTEGIEKGDNKPLAKETTKQDNVSKSTSKLKDILGKKKE